jgi:glycosyltransferase involved in cell wall biosynthesis
MKVLFLAAAGHIAGGNRFLLNLFEEIKTKGIQPILVVPETGNMSNEAQSMGIDVEVLPLMLPQFSQPISSLKQIGAWIKIIQKHKPDIIHANDFLVARSVSVAAKMTKIKLICHVHFKQELAFCQWIFKNMKAPDAFIFCSHATQQNTGPLLSKSYPQSLQKVIYNSVDLEKFKPKSTCSKEPTNKIGMIANIIPRKRIEDFIEVARILTPKWPKLEFELVGADIEKQGHDEKMEVLLTNYDLKNKVNMLGFCSNVAELLDNWDMVLCCADHEELPISLIEATAAGLPIISTDVGGINEIVDNEISGYLVPPRSPQKMAEKIEILLNNPTTLAEMGVEARQIAKQRFGGGPLADTMIEFYEKIIAT